MIFYQAPHLLILHGNFEKKSVSQNSHVKSINEELDKISLNLFIKAKKQIDENIHRVKTIEEAKKFKGIVEIPWCYNKDCALEIENLLDGNTLGEPIENAECKYVCPICNNPAKTWMRYAKSY